MLMLFSIPFFALLLCIAAFPLLPHSLAAWWERNGNKLLVSLAMSGVVLAYYGLRAGGGGFAVGAIAHHALLQEYLPFIVVLFSLYTVAGGIRVTEDIPAHALTNTTILAIGALLANFIGTTGASMLLIRPLLQINSERTRAAHTIIFFIFIVSNIGGGLTPIGDPPLLLGYLYGVPFGWPAKYLWPIWLMAVGTLLGVYFVWDHFFVYPHEPKAAIAAEESTIVPFRVQGVHNLVLLIAIAFLIATIVPGQPWLGTRFIPPMYLREGLMVACAGVGYALTPASTRVATNFSFGPIAEVAALFLGIFITATVPMEYLRNLAGHSHLQHPAAYFWASGALSGMLDNAPTYLIFLALGQASSEHAPLAQVLSLPTGPILVRVLMAISAGSVFMGANTYIGNGPNFMVKKIAEDAGVKMPGFFRYMVYSGCVLIPLFLLITLIFFR